MFQTTNQNMDENWRLRPFMDPPSRVNLRPRKRLTNVSTAKINPEGTVLTNLLESTIEKCNPFRLCEIHQ